jgi:diadenosine tetraphosphate (Ap4A) HIT family hydrolase
MNDTMVKFGYPGSLIRAYGHWTVLLRPKQATLGALVVANASGATAYGDLAPEAYAEFGTVVADAEKTLSKLFQYDRINYLMLMMVDPHVHYHVLPRYKDARNFAGLSFGDSGWPGPPDLSGGHAPVPETLEELRALIAGAWPEAA